METAVDHRRYRAVGFRLWKCQSCGSENPITIRKRVTHALFLCGNCKEQVFVYDRKKGESQFRKGAEPSGRVAPTLQGTL